ncbi:hypothetical protein GCM10011504_29430 [Siccirubricoccus deserti]|nr:hypothetical protein [Siccirubricoccus deserti]GGC49125.1 hypothetical protein GCM10011504_29430 [Siccirubricoccus deserti]
MHWAGRRPDRDKWTLARGIMVLDSNAKADEYMVWPQSALRFY